MILSDTLNQPQALAIFALLGVIFGVIYTLNAFLCSFLIKNPLYRHISQSLYVILYGMTFFGVTLKHFQYDLRIYHIIICIFFTVLTSFALYLPIRKRRSLIMTKCDAFKTRIEQSKLIKKFKK